VRNVYATDQQQTAVLSKLTVAQLVNEVHASYENQRFFAMFTAAQHYALFWAVYMGLRHLPISPKSILILPSHRRLQLPNNLPLRIKMSCSWHATCPTHGIIVMISGVQEEGCEHASC
jgi:hypothetical protein